MQSKPRRGNLVTGAFLVLLGILFLVARFVQFEGWVFLTGLGVVFVAVGWLLKTFGFLIPGGILTGLGLGIGASRYVPEGPGEGGAVVLGIGVGFVLVWILGWLILGERSGWPLIPGGIIGLVGILLLAGSAGLEILDLLGNFWPAILILIGIIALISAFRHPQEAKPIPPEEGLAVASSDEEAPSQPSA